MSEWNEVLSGIVNEERTEGGLTVHRFSLSGDAEANAVADAVGAHYNMLAGRPRPAIEDFATRALTKGKVTILSHNTGTYGHAAVNTMPGTLVTHSSGSTLIVPKGKRAQGFVIDRMLRGGSLLDFEDGYKGEDVLRERALAVRALMPTLSRVTKADFEALPATGAAIKMAVFGTYPFIDERIRGALWLLETYLPEDDILEGWLIVPPGQAYSEHGSLYGKDMLRWNVGKVEGFQGMTGSQAMELCDAPYEDVLAALRA